MSTVIRTVALLIVLAALAGCGDDGPITTAGSGEETAPTTSGEPALETAPTTQPPSDPASPLGSPPPVVFFGANGEVARDPFTFCWSGPASSDGEAMTLCADGIPATDLPAVVPLNGIVQFAFPVDGWSFTANLLDADRSLEVDHVSGHLHQMIVPEDLSAEDVIVVSGRGPEGDIHVALTIDADPDTLRVVVIDSCAWGIGLEFGADLYLLEGDLRGIEHPGSGMWARSDFPDEWDVIVWNGTPADGDDWAIRDAVAHRLDATTLDVRHAGTNDPIGVFVLDPRPAGQRPACG